MEQYGLYLLVGWIVIGFSIELYKNPILRNWLKKSVMYFIDKKRITKELEAKSDEYKRDYWLDEYIVYKQPKFWFEKAMEKYIRTKYIEEINEKETV